MLPKTNRIRKKRDFETIFANSKSLKNSLFIFRIAKNNLGLNRFGFVVSLKVSKRAVVRNKVRRRLAEIMAVEEKSIKPGKDIVLIALPGIEKKEFSEIKEAIHNICSNL
ncbi:MAG: ribonuclease P protein component [Candidatus Staskawiczbacteria bacterium]|nr:ribonuclease P protein component [Candidatus Staskawiczbacteria bacterium]